MMMELGKDGQGTFFYEQKLVKCESSY